MCDVVAINDKANTTIVVVIIRYVNYEAVREGTKDHNKRDIHLVAEGNFGSTKHILVYLINEINP